VAGLRLAGAAGEGAGRFAAVQIRGTSVIFDPLTDWLAWLCRLGKCPGRTPSHARGSCLWEGHFTRRWLFRAGDAGSGSLLSVYPWNRTMPWIAGQDGGDPGRRSSVCLAMGAPFPRVTR